MNINKYTEKAREAVATALDLATGANNPNVEPEHLLAALIKGSVLTHQRQHAAHSRGELRVFDVQFDVRRKLAGMAVRAQVVGTRDFHLADCRQDRLGAQLPVVSLLAARTREGALVGSWGWEVQQFGQRCCARLMHG